MRRSQEIALRSDGTRVTFTTTGNDLGFTDTNDTRGAPR